MNDKGLQEFTQITDEKSLDLYMESNPDTSWDELHAILLKQANKPIENGQEKEYQRKAALLIYGAKKYGPHDTYLAHKNTTYQYNHKLILGKIHERLFEYGTFPTMARVAADTGLSRTTVYKHLRDIDNSDLEFDAKMQQKALVTQAMGELYKIGVREKNPTALKYFIQFADPSTRLKTVNNYVQINQIRLSQEDIQKLPDEVIRDIEDLIRPTVLETSL